MLNVLGGWDLGGFGYRSARIVHLMAETMRHAYVDRNTLMGDPEFVADRRARLLSPDHAAAIRAAIDPEKATPSSALGPGVAPHEPAETTHYSVVDGDGNAVSVTYTLNGNFGAGVVAPGTGFLLNNEMDDFTVKPGAANLFGWCRGRPTRSRPANSRYRR
jgi:gamma-glutamyltranspeptidase/glutathione hydrolase